MTPMARLAVGAVVLTVLAAALSGWAGVQYGLQQARPAPGLDEILHHELALTSDQDRQIATLESQFSERRKVLEEDMRAANRDLAAAIQSEHEYGSRAKQAVERFHTAMITLQEATIMHILAMRAVLTPEQAKQFDETVSKALASDQS